MATFMFSRLAPRFQHSTFIELTTEEGISKLKEHLVTALEGLGATGFSQQESATVLLNTLLRYVSDRAILLVLDNVSSAEQVDSLLPPKFGPGSKIIITSRESSPLYGSSWMRQVIYIREFTVTMAVTNASNTHIQLASKSARAWPVPFEITSYWSHRVAYGAAVPAVNRSGAVNRSSIRCAWSRWRVIMPQGCSGVLQTCHQALSRPSSFPAKSCAMQRKQ